jgi:hypothetical protein
VNTHDARAHGVEEFIEAEVIVRARDFLQEHFHVHDLEVERAEGPRAHDAEILIAHHDGIARAPLVAGEEPRVDVINVGLEG